MKKLIVVAIVLVGLAAVAYKMDVPARLGIAWLAPASTVPGAPTPTTSGAASAGVPPAAQPASGSAAVAQPAADVAAQQPAQNPAPGAAGPDTAPSAPSGSPVASESATASGAVPPPGAAPQPAAQVPAAPAPAGAVAVAQAGQPIANKAIEVRVTGHRTAPSIGNRTADAGREFVIVDSSWKNIIPKVKVNRKKATDRTGGMGALGFGGGTTAKDKAEDEANTTLESMAFEMSPMPQHVWLIADGRSAPIDVNGTRTLQGFLAPDRLTIKEFEQVISGGLAFQAPPNAQSLALLVLDTSHGHLLLPIKGVPPVLASSLGGSARANEFVDLALTGTSWSDSPIAGMRTFVVGIKGISRQPALVDVPFGQYAFLQTAQGCLVPPDPRAQGLTAPLAPMGRFLPFVPNEGQLAFQVPSDTQGTALLVRLQRGGPIDLPLTGAKPSWPAAEATITDGNVLRVMKLPGTAVPPGLAGAPAGNERVALDLVVENLRSGAGIDLQPREQFRLVDPDGKRYMPAADSSKVPCSLAGNVVPAGGARRFTLVYDVPPGVPLQLEYRGFNVKSELVKVR